MKIKKIHNRAQPHPSNSWGDRDGKLYYGTNGEGFTPAPMPESINTSLGYKGEYLNRNNPVPECDEGMAIVNAPYMVVGFGGQKGVRNRPFESKMGATAGKSFIYVNGGLVATDGSIGYRQGPATTAASRVIEIYSCCEVLFETETHFVIFNRTIPRAYADYGLARLMYIHKNAGSESVQILSGYFDCVYLGKCRTATAGVYRHCIAFMTGAITDNTASGSDQFTQSIISEPDGEGVYATQGLGARLHILTVSDAVNNAAAYSWLLQGRKIGSGNLGGNYYFNRGHKYKVTFDESLIFRDAEGYISRFSYVGHIPELGEEIWETKDKSTSSVQIEKLQQTFGICHVDFGVAETNLPTLNFSHQQIVMPEELMAYDWTFTGSDTSKTLIGTALLSGRSWRTANKLYCLMIDGTYRYTQYRASRPSSMASGVLVSADIDEYNNIANVKTHVIPARFGLESDFEIQLLSADKQLVWLPTVTPPYSTLVCVDLHGDTPEITSHTFDTFFSSMGTRGNELMVTFGTTNSAPVLLALGDQPEVSMNFDTSQYAPGDIATLTVTAAADSTCTVQLRNCIHNHQSSIVVTALAGVPQTFQVRVLGEPSAHLIHVE